VLLDLGSELPVHPYERARALTRFGDILRNTLRDSDIACRLGNSVFGLILEDTAESGAVWATERLQIALSTEDRPPSQMVAGVASYPNHGLAAQDVLSRAQDALGRARTTVASGMGQVEVATEDHS
jgi:diguanylate cyclase (GGDEF)-like protein